MYSLGKLRGMDRPKFFYVFQFTKTSEKIDLTLPINSSPSAGTNYPSRRFRIGVAPAVSLLGGL